MLRVFYFLATNIAIMIVLSISMRILGVEPYLQQNGLNLTSLLIFAAAFGMGGSFISLAMSKRMAKRFSGAQVIESPSNNQEKWLLSTVQSQAGAAGIAMPEVAIFESTEVNAFATGMKKNSALIAVSRGLLNNMTQEEVEAVLGHEISHVANGDMVTLALIQGVVNTFVIFLSRVIGQLVDKVIFRNQRGYGIGFWVTTIIAEIMLGILASIIVMYFSRRREFRADEGGAHLSSKTNMIAALERLKVQHELSVLPDQIAAFGISGRPGAGFRRLFMSHPPLDERIDALKVLK